MLKLIGGIFLMVMGVEVIAFAQQIPAPPARSSEELSQGTPANPADLSVPSTPTPATADELERALKQHEEAQQQVTDPARPRTHRYMDQPVARILRSLAEQAEINYVEPGIPENEITSVVLTNMTPLQAFEAVARAHGFRIQIDGQNEVYTLERSDILSPSYYEVRRYTLKYQSAEDLIQATAGYLGIQIKPAADSNPSYPRPQNTAGGSAAYAGAQEVVSGAQSLYSSGTEQTRPRFISGLPFDDPLSTGGFGNWKENAVWVERSTNSLMVRATPQEHAGLADQIRVWDRQENQIQINTYVVEVSKNDDLFGGVDWSNTLGQNGATFTLTGNVGATPIGITSAGFGGPFFNNGLILKFPDVAATIRALAQRGKLRSTNSPVTYTKTAVPVQIRSVTQQTIFLQTAATANVQATTTPYTFTTGLTIDLVGRILKGGIIDLKINPALSTQTGQSPAQPGTNTTVPIISTRTATADVQVRSGDAAVIGGITEDVDNFTENGVPGVRKLPIVGYLFSTRQKMRDRTNLVIIVWPRIIKGTAVRTDRAGSDETEMLGQMSDLPGEPPPLRYGREGKEIPSKAPVYYNVATPKRRSAASNRDNGYGP
jgi:type II secretory pathway component GspD/PulD (secretin)